MIDRADPPEPQPASGTASASGDPQPEAVALGGREVPRRPKRLVELVVFISGTSDMDRLALEAISIIDSIDKVLCPSLGVTLRPVRGLTNARAGVGRPQALINPLVERCHLFVGVFGRRIGTPTGTAESGTKEELEIALGRAERGGGVPGVLVFFKSLSANDRVDPGPQLEGILRLREDLRGRLLWVEYHSVSNFRARFLEQLLQWLLSVVPISATWSSDANASRSGAGE